MPRQAALSLDVDQVPELMADLGYLLVPGAPRDVPPAYLLVALRRRPTLRHFDPERVICWASEAGKAAERTLDWHSAAGESFAWGRIRVVDRLGEVNRFVGFGGALRVLKTGDMRVAILASPAPILELGGHSDPADPYAVAIDGFLARLRAAAGSNQMVARAATATPTELYAAFLERGRLSRARPNLTMAEATVQELMRRERLRLATGSETDLRDGARLARRLVADEG